MYRGASRGGAVGGTVGGAVCGTVYRGAPRGGAVVGTCVQGCTTRWGSGWHMCTGVHHEVAQWVAQCVAQCTGVQHEVAQWVAHVYSGASRGSAVDGAVYRGVQIPKYLGAT